MTPYLPSNRRIGPAVLVAVALAASSFLSPATAAQPEVVGVLALILEQDVDRRLNLDENQKRELTDLINSLQTEAAQAMASLGDLPLSERLQRLAPIRYKAEEIGLAILSDQQQLTLQQVRIKRMGFVALAAPGVAKRLKLDQLQQAEVAKLLKQRAEAMAREDPIKAPAIHSETELALGGILNEQQRIAWQALISGTAIAAPDGPETESVASPEAAATEPIATATVEAAETAPEASEAPETVAPETVAPETVVPETVAPETVAPETVVPETVVPETVAPETVAPEAVAPEAVAPEAVAPEAVAPETVAPQVAAPETVAPQVAAPETTEVAPAESPATAPTASEGPPVEMAEGTVAATTPPAQWPPSVQGDGSDTPWPPLGPSDDPSRSWPAEDQPGQIGPPAESRPAEEVATNEPLLRFSFNYHPWVDVLDWFAEQADLSLGFENAPSGTCNYHDDRKYTPDEAIDLLNKLLLTKGYVLVRNNRMLLLINLEDGIPPNLVPIIPLEELDRRAEFDLVSVLFELETVTAEEANQEIEKLVGPQGSVVPLPKAKQLLVTETAGRLRTIRQIIEKIEGPQGQSGKQLQAFPLEFTLADEVMGILRQLLDIPAESNTTPDGSVHLALDALGTRLIVAAPPKQLEEVAKILEAIDAPMTGEFETDGVETAIQFEVYPVAPANPQSVLKVMQTLLAGSPGARLDVDPTTGNLIALAKADEHATIKATLEQMRYDANNVAVIQLRSMDPLMAVSSIKKLFGGDEESSTLTVDADMTTRQLFIRAPETLITQIRLWLDEMGEGEPSEEGVAKVDSVRVLPLTGRTAQSALDLLKEIWPTMRANRIREIKTSSSTVPTRRVSPKTEDPRFDDILNEALLELLGPDPYIRTPAEVTPSPARPEPDSQPAPENAENLNGQSAQAPLRARPLRGRVFFASEFVQQESEPNPDPPAQQQADLLPRPQLPDELPPITVTLGPGGMMIASEDIEALNAFEELLTTLTANAIAGGPELVFFYLKHAEATAVATTLSQILAGESLAFGSPGGGLVSSLLGLDGEQSTISTSSSAQIIPYARLNALAVRANPVDIDRIEQLLRILDQQESPEEVMTQPRPQMIPVYNMQADEVAAIVKEIYQERLFDASSRNRQSSPQDFFQAMQRSRGGGGAPGGNSRGATTDTGPKMTVSVDARNNSLIVSAPDSLFQEVKQMVEQIDASALGSSNQAVEIVTLKRSNTEAVQKALTTLMGESVQFGSNSSRSRSGSSGSGSSGGPSSMSGDMQQRMEMYRAIRERMGGGDGPPGFGGGRPGGGGPGGGGPGGGRSGGSSGGRPGGSR